MQVDGHIFLREAMFFSQQLHIMAYSFFYLRFQEINVNRPKVRTNITFIRFLSEKRIELSRNRLGIYMSCNEIAFDILFNLKLKIYEKKINVTSFCSGYFHLLFSKYKCYVII